MTKTIYAKRQQVIDQCRAVAALCDSLAELHRARESLLTAGFCDDLVEITGRRSVSIMEALADFLNNMDAVGDGDEWISEVLIAGLDMFPEKSTGAEAVSTFRMSLEEIYDLAVFAGLRVAGIDEEVGDDITLSTQHEMPTFVVDDEGTRTAHRYIAYLSEHPEEGAVGLGSDLSHALEQKP